MSTSQPSASDQITAVMAYTNLCVGEALTHLDTSTDVATRAHRAHLALDALARYDALAESLPGGHGACAPLMEAIASPLNEWNVMTRAHSADQRWAKLLAVAAWQIELLAALPEGTRSEALDDVTAAWRVIDEASSRISAPGELALYARRLLGEGAVMSQRLIVRHPAVRQAVAGGEDDDLSISGEWMDALLQRVAGHLANVGIGV